MTIYLLNRLSLIIGHEWLHTVDILLELGRCEFHKVCIFHQGVK